MQTRLAIYPDVGTFQLITPAVILTLPPTYQLLVQARLSLFIQIHLLHHVPVAIIHIFITGNTTELRTRLTLDTNECTLYFIAK